MRSSSLRQVLVAVGIVLLIAVGGLTALVVSGLGRADKVLDHLSRSQSQLADVIKIRADLYAAVLSFRARDPTSATALRDIQNTIVRYRESIARESAVLSRSPVNDAHQAEELSNAENLNKSFEALKRDLNSGSDLDRDRARFDRLAVIITSSESAEALASIEEMRELRKNVAIAAVLTTLLITLLGVVVGWGLFTGVARPIRALQRAVDGVSMGKSFPSSRRRGFREFQHLTDAFNRMAIEIADQRAALIDINRDLEAKVADRTSEIQASRAAIADADRNRRLFVSKVSHELRTPATVIRGEAEVSLRSKKQTVAELLESLQRIASYSIMLQHRLDDLLTLARAEDGKLLLQFSELSVTNTVRLAIDLAQPYARIYDVAISADLPDSGEPFIKGDAGWLQQTVLALIDNAAKFAQSDHGVRVAVRMKDGRAEIAVTDGGGGVDEADLPFLFDDFYQARTSRGGSGLGLSVARWVVEQHGGSISARNQAGEGLKVQISLPLAA